MQSSVKGTRSRLQSWTSGWRGAAIGLAVIVASGAAIGPAAAENRGTQEQQAACTPDVMRLCSSEISNGIPAIVACMKRKRSQLSGECLAALHSKPTRVARDSPYKRRRHLAYH